jgi:hypothetical protein
MPPSVGVEFDDSRWPKVYIRWPSEPLGDDDFKRAVLQMSSYTKRGQPFVTILDGRTASRPTAVQRSFAAEVQKADAEASRRWLRGSAIIVSNPLLVGIVTAINWVVTPSYPQKIFATLDAAEAWTTEQLEQSR